MSDEMEERATTPLVDEALKKAAVAWVRVPGGPALALWCVPLQGALFLVSGPGEQAAPGLATTTEAEVTLRGDHSGRIVTFPARVSRVEPGGEEWETVAPAVAGKRLNASGSATDLMARWVADGCALNRLEPAGTPLAGSALPADAQAEPPRETPAVRRVRKPFRLHRVRRR